MAKRVAFTNASIVAPRAGKPHICLRAGWWRVSSFEKHLRRSPTKQDRWRTAHNYAATLNNAKGR